MLRHFLFNLHGPIHIFEGLGFNFDICWSFFRISQKDEKLQIFRQTLKFLKDEQLLCCSAMSLLIKLGISEYVLGFSKKLGIKIFEKSFKTF